MKRCDWCCCEREPLSEGDLCAQCESRADSLRAEGRREGLEEAALVAERFGPSRPPVARGRQYEDRHLGECAASASIARSIRTLAGGAKAEPPFRLAEALRDLPPLPHGALASAEPWREPAQPQPDVERALEEGAWALEIVRRVSAHLDDVPRAERALAAIAALRGGR